MGVCYISIEKPKKIDSVSLRGKSEIIRPAGAAGGGSIPEVTFPSVRKTGTKKKTGLGGEQRREAIGKGVS